jgi:activator of HSP90 ATPase
VKVSSRFMASAEDLWNLFTDEGRIPMWSRAPAQVSASFDMVPFLIRYISIVETYPWWCFFTILWRSNR